MNRVVFFCIALHTGLLFSACNTFNQVTSIEIETLVPAYLTASEQPADLVIVNRVPVYTGGPDKGQPAGQEINNPGTHNQSEENTRQYLAEFRRLLKESGLFNEIVTLDQMMETASDSLTVRSLNAAELSEITNLYPGTDMLLFLEFLRAGERTVYMQHLYWYRMDVVVNSLWQIARTGADSVVYFYSKTDTVTWEGEAASARAMNRYLPGKKQAIKVGLEESAAAFAKLFIPHWEKVSRMMYLSGNYEMRRAQKYAMQNEWGIAYEIWKSLEDNRNRHIAAKATYNLALASEMSGEISGALDWILKSYFIWGESNSLHARNAKEYINVINRRKREYALLERQMNN